MEPRIKDQPRDIPSHKNSVQLAALLWLVFMSINEQAVVVELITYCELLQCLLLGTMTMVISVIHLCQCKQYHKGEDNLDRTWCYYLFVYLLKLDNRINVQFCDDTTESINSYFQPQLQFVIFSPSINYICKTYTITATNLIGTSRISACFHAKIKESWYGWMYGSMDDII